MFCHWPGLTAFRTGEAMRPMEPQTIADSIAVGVPEELEESRAGGGGIGGAMIDVSDEEILEAMRSPAG